MTHKFKTFSILALLMSELEVLRAGEMVETIDTGDLDQGDFGSRCLATGYFQPKRCLVSPSRNKRTATFVIVTVRFIVEFPFIAQCSWLTQSLEVSG